MNTDYLEKIEAYLNGEMSPVAKSEFEAALLADEELYNTFKMYRTIEADMRGVEKYKIEDDALKSTLNTLNNKYFAKEAQPAAKVIPLQSTKFLKIFTGIAASVAIVLISYFTFLKPAENMQELADN